MYKVIYKKETGRVVGYMQGEFTLEEYLADMSTESLESLGTVNVSSDLSDYRNHMVAEGELVRMTSQEISEMQVYNRILTVEERLLEQMKPSDDDVRKAEMTIEVLSILEGVI